MLVFLSKYTAAKNYHEIIILNSVFHNPYDYIIKFSSQNLFMMGRGRVVVEKRGFPVDISQYKSAE